MYRVTIDSCALRRRKVYMTNHWWDESAGFFGNFYMQGDESVEGHLAARQLTLAERTVNEVNGVIKLLNLRDKNQILDVPCGYGRHAIELAKRRFDVVGVDLNTTHLGVAKKQAKEDGLNIQFRRKNMLSLPFVGEFDAVINMFYSFGFFDTDEENMLALKNFRKALKPGGKFLMHTDVNIPRILSGQYKTDEKRNLVSGGVLHIQDRYNPISKRIEGVWTIHENSNVVRKAYSVRVYDEGEFKSMCLEAGFGVCNAFGDWEGGEYIPAESEEIIFVAHSD